MITIRSGCSCWATRVANQQNGQGLGGRTAGHSDGSGIRFNPAVSLEATARGDPVHRNVNHPGDPLVDLLVVLAMSPWSICQRVVEGGVRAGAPS